MTRNDVIKDILFNAALENTDSITYYIDPGLSQKINSTFSIVTDMELAIAYAKNLITLGEAGGSPWENSNGLNGLWYGLIVMYGRCFTENKAKNTRLETSIFLGNDDLLLIHQKIMKLRHEFVAHRGDSMMEVSVMLLHIKPLPDGSFEKYFDVKTRLTSFEPSDLKEWIRLFEFVHDKAISYVNKERVKLLRRISQFSDEEVNKILISNILSEPHE